MSAPDYVQYRLQDSSCAHGGVHRCEKNGPTEIRPSGLRNDGSRSGGTLLIQHDLGTTKAHVLVVRVTETNAVITHTDIHLQRLRFFQGLLAETRIQWDELHSHQASAMTRGDLFYIARGHFAMSWVRSCSFSAERGLKVSSVAKTDIVAPRRRVLPTARVVAAVQWLRGGVIYEKPGFKDRRAYRVPSCLHMA